MALVRFDKNIKYMRGRVGGVYFKRGNHSVHIQAMPRIVAHTLVGAAGINRNGWSALSGIAIIMIAAGYLALWVAYAGQWLWKNKDGDWIKLTWWNWFAHYNMKLIIKGLPPILIPPAGPPT